MDKSTARQLVLISMLVTGSVIIYDVTKNKGSLQPNQEFRAVWSMSLLFLLLAIMSDTVPEVAGPFAGLVTLSVVVGREGALSSIVNIGTQASSKSGVQVTPTPVSYNVRPATHPGTNP